MKQAIQLATLSAANIVIAFLFQWYVITSIGPGIETDALFAGMTLPQLVLAVISGSLMHVLVPLLAGEEESEVRRDAWMFFVLVGGIFSFLAGGLYLSANLWVPYTVPGFDAKGLSLTIELTRVQLIGMVFAAVNGVQWAAYHARQKFFFADFTPIVASAVSFALLVWALPRYGVLAAAWIGTLRFALQTIFLAPGMGWPVRPNRDSAAIKAAWRRIKPLLLGTAYYKTDVLVDRLLLSTAASGTLSLYYLAQQIYGAIITVLNKAIATPLVPLLSSLSKSGDQLAFKRAYRARLLQVGVISSVVLLALALLGRWGLTLLIGYGNITSDDLDGLWWVMIWLGGMFFGGALGHITSATFYSVGDTVTPTRIGIISYTIYIPVKLASYLHFGVPGLAISTSIYFMANLVAQGLILERRYVASGLVDRANQK